MKRWANIIGRLPRRQNSWLVGGAVRDLWLQRSPTDVDVAVATDAAGFAHRTAQRTRGKAITIQSRRGFKLHRVIAPGLTIDVTPLGGTSIETDLRRRDFTINAMAVAISDGRLLDPCNGRADLRRRIIRSCSPSAFRRDPVRLLRAFRIGTQLGFTISSDTLDAVADHAGRIGSSAAERVSSELLDFCAHPESAPYLRIMAKTGLLVQILPEMASLQKDRGAPQHDFDTWEHSLRTYEHLEQIINHCVRRFPLCCAKINVCNDTRAAALLKLSALLHDIGKPACRSIDGKGRVHYYAHETLGAAMVTAAGERLRLPRLDRIKIAQIVRHHLRPLLLYNSHRHHRPTQRAVTRFLRVCGADSPAILLLALADQEAKTSVGQAEAFTVFVRQQLKGYFDVFERRQRQPPMITGQDLIDHFGLRPSPLFAKILDAVEEDRLAGHLRSRSAAISAVEAYLENPAHTGPGQWSSKKNG